MPPGGYPGPHQYPQHPQRQALPRAVVAVWTFAGISVLATVLGLTLKENGANAWKTVDAWGALPIAGAVVTALPAIGHAFGLTPERARQVAAGGAAALVLFWILFVLPNVSAQPNTTLLATLGAAAGLAAVWVAPGRVPEPARGHTW